MNYNNIKILILLATYNREHLIGATLDSIQAQTYSDWECIIIDDNSVDNTASIIEKYVKYDNRFFFYPKNDQYKKGLSGSRNYALDIAAGRNPDFIQFFDDDDLMHPQKLELQLEELLKNPDCKFSLCGRLNFQDEKEINFEETQPIFHSSKLKAGEAFLKGDLRFGVQATLLKYDFIKDLRFDDDLEYAEDWVYFSKLIFQCHPNFSVINKVLFYRRKHLASMTGTGVKEISKRAGEVMAGMKIFNFLTNHNLHTKTSLFYFGRRFLLYQFDSAKIKEIDGLIKVNKECSNLDHLLYRSAIKIHQGFRRFLLRILNFKR